MKFAISPCILIIAALVALAWRFHEPVLRAIYQIRADRLRLRIERRVGGRRVVCIVGHVDDDAAEKWMMAIRAAPEGHLDVLIHTNGGACQARSRVARALSQHKGLTIAHVPGFAWSAGTGIALACDRIHMTEDAVLGPCDPGRSGPQQITFCAVEALSHETSTPHDVIRSHQALDEGEADLRRAREARRAFWGTSSADVAKALATMPTLPQPVDPDAHLVAQLVRGGWGNHWRPIYLEDAKALGLDARLEGLHMGKLFSELARLSMLALPEAQR